VTSSRPIYTGKSPFLHGWARRDIETAPGMEPTTWWGSNDFTLSADVQETVVRLQAEDGAHSRAILYQRGGERCVLMLNHPRGDFSCHYMIPLLIEAGYAVLGGQVRTFGNDSDCVHECLLADLAAQVRYLRASKFEHVVLLGNSGGGSLATFYQAQAATDPPHRLTHTPAGDPYDLNELDLVPAHAVVLLAAHVGEGAFLLENLDPSVTDENDPLSCDPSLDMFNPTNGYRKPPERSSYSAEFLARYRQAQRARCARIDAIAHQVIERRRRYQTNMTDPEFAELPLDEQLHITRLATASRYLTVYRTSANPSYTDLSIHPSNRIISTLLGPDPHTTNYKLGGFASVMTPEGWLSTWSGLSSRASVIENIKHIDQPVLVVSFEADAGILPHEGEAMFNNARTEDKALVRVDADHYGFARTGPREATIREAAAQITQWLDKRFPPGP
jgi:pimeloyl-ACP methyl ester carboxylesterase